MSRTQQIVLGVFAAAGLAILVAALASVGRSGNVRARTRLPGASGPASRAESRTGPFTFAQEPRDMGPVEGPTGAVSGLVWAPSGSPAGDADVAAFTFDGHPRVAARARTDAEGRYLLSSIPPGVYTIQADKAGVGAAYLDGVWVEADNVSALRPLLLRGGRVFRLLILHRPGRDPATGATVRPPAADLTLRIDRVHHRTERSAFDVHVGVHRTDAAGRVDLAPLPDGHYRLHVSRTVVERVNDREIAQVRDAEMHDFEVRDGRLVARILWQPPRAAAIIEIDISDAGGAPIQGIWAGAYRVQFQDRFSFGLLVDETRTDARGRAAFSLSDELGHCAVFVAADGAMLHRPFQVLSGGLYEIERRDGKVVPLPSRVVGKVARP